MQFSYSQLILVALNTAKVNFRHCKLMNSIDGVRD
jgi:hypothetical protein